MSQNAEFVMYMGILGISMSNNLPVNKMEFLSYL